MRQPKRLVTAAIVLSAAACSKVDIHAVTISLDASTEEVVKNTAASVPSVFPPVESTTRQPEQPPTTTAAPEAPEQNAAPQTQLPDAGLVANCPDAVLKPGDSSLTIDVEGTPRSFVLHVPETYDGVEPVPLIVDFHGMGSSSWDELDASPYPAETDPEGVIMAFPEGLPGPLGATWNMGPCCVRGVDDLAFTRAMVARIRETACVAPNRIYAVGVLTGGGMAHHLACEAADLFAAVAPASFDLLAETVEECLPSRPITVISFRGTEDSRVPYAGGASALVPGMPITFLGAEGTTQRWAAINNCNDAPSSPDVNGCVSYPDCSMGVEVILCTDEGGREGPGAADVAWPVLKRHTL